MKFAFHIRQAASYAPFHKLYGVRTFRHLRLESILHQTVTFNAIIQ